LVDLVAKSTTFGLRLTAGFGFCLGDGYRFQLVGGKSFSIQHWRNKRDGGRREKPGQAFHKIEGPIDSSF